MASHSIYPAVSASLTWRTMSSRSSVASSVSERPSSAWLSKTPVPFTLTLSKLSFVLLVDRFQWLMSGSEEVTQSSKQTGKWASWPRGSSTSISQMWSPHVACLAHCASPPPPPPPGVCLALCTCRPRPDRAGSRAVLA